MKRLAILGILLVAACGPSAKPGPGGTASPTTPVASASGPTPSSSAPLTPVAFACRLPVSMFSNGLPQGAFVTFPSGELAVDPSGAFQRAGAGLQIKSVAQPYLSGFGNSLTFTRRFGRWLPAAVADVSPDSSQYAYWEFSGGSALNGRVHVVDVTSSTDRVVYSQGFYAVIDFESEGIYVARTGPTGEAQYGLWLLDPGSGSLQAVGSPNQIFYIVGGGAAWYADVAPGDQAPVGYTLPADRVSRLDLKIKTVTVWFYRPGVQVDPVGLDGESHPIVRVSTKGSTELWLVTAPGTERRIYDGPGMFTQTSRGEMRTPDSLSLYGAPLADSHGVWFGSSLGIFLYTPDGGFRKVSTATGAVAGRCLER